MSRWTNRDDYEFVRILEFPEMKEKKQLSCDRDETKPGGMRMIWRMAWYECGRPRV